MYCSDTYLEVFWEGLYYPTFFTSTPLEGEGLSEVIEYSQSAKVSLKPVAVCTCFDSLACHFISALYIMRAHVSHQQLVLYLHVTPPLPPLL